MPAILDWRSPTDPDAFAQLDYADFAQEFLRRNPEYGRQYRLMINRVGEEGLDHEAEAIELARQWGLSFRVRPRPFGRKCPCALVARAGGNRRHHGERASVSLRAVAPS